MSDHISRDKALAMLEEAGCDERVIAHCKAVCQAAVDVAGRVAAAGREVDLDFIESAALLHDIGRARSHGMDHGLTGAEILSEHPRFARVCERHLGAGFTAKEAESFGLPARDMLPETLEEKIIAYADNCVEGDKILSWEEGSKRIAERLKDDGAVQRMEALAREVEGYCKK